MATQSAIAVEYLPTNLLGVPDEIRFRLSLAVEDQATLLQGVAMGLASTRLGFRKGDLVGSIERGTWQGRYGPKGAVFSRWYVARFYELGYGGGSYHVHGYVRRNRAGSATKAQLRAAHISRGLVAKRPHGAEYGPVAPAKNAPARGVAYVREHERKIPRFQVSFLRDALEQQRFTIRAALEGALGRG